MSSFLFETVGCVRSLDCFKYLGSAGTVQRKRNENFSEGNKQYIFGSYMRGMIKSQRMTKYQINVVSVGSLPWEFQSGITKSHALLFDKLNLVSIPVILN